MTTKLFYSCASFILLIEACAHEPPQGAGNSGKAETGSPTLMTASSKGTAPKNGVTQPFAYRALIAQIPKELTANNYDSVDNLLKKLPDESDFDFEIHQHLYILSESLRYKN